MNESHPHITAVICALNEERSIGDVIQGCANHVDEILVVDGHSVDRTVTIASQLGAKVIVDQQKGKGAAIRESIQHVRSDIVVYIDADGSHDPDDIPKLVRPILEDDADHVSGSRQLGGSSELHGGFDECLRLMGSSFITACINWKFRVRLSESQNGFRAIRRSVLASLGLVENITTIEQEMIMKTLQQGFRMAEVPTHEHMRRFGDSHIRVSRVAHRYVWTLMKYCLFATRRIQPRKRASHEAGAYS